jgi:hypothetical protein
LFLDDRTVTLSQSTAYHHDHPPGPLRVIEYNVFDARHNAGPCSRNGWSGVLVSPHTKRFSAWRKSVGGLTPERAVCGDDYYSLYPGREGAQYQLTWLPGVPPASFRAHWADFDSEGRLVAAAGGRLFWGVPTRKRGSLSWSEIASLASERFEPVTAPDWAQQW